MKYTVATVLSAAALVTAAVPGIPTEARARDLLGSLTIRAPIDDGTYNRDLFPHWSTVEGTCSGREFVLRRDGSNVVVGADCYPTAGTWFSSFEGKTWTQPADISIDHLVPLKNAWISGAKEWTTAKRQGFANDVKGPQLWTVTPSVNSAKGDSTPDKWKPTLTNIHCDYAKAWIQVKSSYDLTASAAEQAALEQMLGRC